VVRRAERWEALARTEAAELNGMDRQTLRDRVHRFNAFGVEGLKSRRSSSRAPALTQLQRAELLDLVITGPDPEVHGMVRWRCVDLRTEVARRFWARYMRARTARHACNRARIISERIPRPTRLLKKLRRPGQSRATRGGRRPAAQDLVSYVDDLLLARLLGSNLIRSLAFICLACCCVHI
jgi:hypothetical protein